MTMQVSFTHQYEYARIGVERHRSWIEAQLGCSLEECLLLEAHELHLAPAAVVPELSSIPDTMGTAYVDVTRGSFLKPDDTQYVLKWKLTPQLFKSIGGISYVLYSSVGPSAYDSVGVTRNYVITRRTQADVLLPELLAMQNPRSRIRMLRTIYKPSVWRLSRIRQCAWESIGTSAAAQSLRLDATAFANNAKWYTDHDIPYKRGYLLHGPPGNGKTSAIRVMASELGMDCYTISFGSADVNDNELREVFKDAESAAPAIVMFEDLDRVFGRNSSTHTKITFQSLLNCLDGVDTPEGIITVATANRPDEMDTSILKRPGRFDRILEFANPTAAERAAYLDNRLAGSLTGQDRDKLVDITDGFSFAQMKEMWSRAAVEKFHGGDPGMPTAEELQVGVDSICSTYSDMRARKSGKVGFGAKAATA